MKKWAVILITLAGLDVLTTYFSLSLGGIEANPLFRDMNIESMAAIKMCTYIPIAFIALRLKLRALLIFISGANMASTLSNLMVISTLKAM